MLLFSAELSICWHECCRNTSRAGNQIKRTLTRNFFQVQKTESASEGGQGGRWEGEVCARMRPYLGPSSAPGGARHLAGCFRSRPHPPGCLPPPRCAACPRRPNLSRLPPHCCSSSLEQEKRGKTSERQLANWIGNYVIHIIIWYSDVLNYSLGLGYLFLMWKYKTHSSIRHCCHFSNTFCQIFLLKQTCMSSILSRPSLLLFEWASSEASKTHRDQHFTLREDKVGDLLLLRLAQAPWFCSSCKIIHECDGQNFHYLLLITTSEDQKQYIHNSSTSHTGLVFLFFIKIISGVLCALCVYGHRMWKDPVRLNICTMSFKCQNY